MMIGRLRDLRYPLRRLGAQPGFTAAVVATLALGIGMTTAIFSLLDASLLRALPFDDGQRLVYLQGYADGPDGPRLRGASFAEIRDWRELNRSFSAVAVADGTALNLTGPEGAQRVPAEVVSLGYFRLLGASPLMGRVFESARSAASGPVTEAVIGEALWRRRFGARDDILGTRIVLNDVPMTVVGVMPADFSGITFASEVWVSDSAMWLLGAPGGPESRADRWLVPVARLRPGVSAGAAQADMDAVAAGLASRYPDTNAERGVLVTPVRDVLLGDTRLLVWALFGAAGLLLMIACANVVNLYLARASARRHEVVLRAALGARRWELVRVYLGEALLLAAAGALAGFLLAGLGARALAALAPQGLLPPYAHVALDWRSFGVTVALASLIGSACAVAPAAFGYRADVAEVLKGGSRNATSRHGIGLRQALVVGEIALALTIVTAATLVMRSFQNELAVAPGYDASRVLAFRLELPQADYDVDELAPFARELTDALEAIPGVRSAALGSSLPLRGRASANFVTLPNEPGDRLRAFRHQVTPGYFRTMGIALLSGQSFGAVGTDGSAAIVSEAFAKRVFPERNPVGESLQLGATRVRIVGVAADARYRDLTSNLAAGQDDPDFYLPYRAFPDRSFDVAVRTRGDPAALVGPVRSAVSRIDPGLPVFDAAPLAAALDAQTARSRFGSTLLGAFSFSALMLAAVGIYGLMSFMVSERAREFAIRMATGASGPAIRRLVFRRSLALALAGVPLGLAGAVALGRYMEALLFGVGGLDASTHGLALALLLGAVSVSVWLPAARAARTDLTEALRHE